MIIRSKYIHLILVILIALLSGCTTPKKLAQKRVEKAEQNKGDIVIGVTWPSSVVESDFHDGMIMALNEINTEGLLGGRRMKLIVKDNEGSVEVARKIAREFARNTDMIAVIGHYYSDLALPASLTYESSGLLFISPDAMLPSLSQHGLRLFFRISPTNVILAKEAAKYTQMNNYQHPLVVLVRSHWGINLTHNYEIELSRYNVDVVGNFSFFFWEEDFRRIFDKIKQTDHDIIFLAVAFPDGAYIIRDARKKGITSPFLVIDFNKTPYLNLLQPNLNGIINVDPFDQENESPVAQKFIKKFTEIYGRIPEGCAANGYDALKLLAHAIETSQTTNPYKLAEDLHFYDHWEGVTGIFDFDKNGDPINKKVHVKQYIDDKYLDVSLVEYVTEDVYHEIYKRLEDEINKHEFHISRDINHSSISITITDAALFHSGTVDLTKSGQNILDKVLQVIITRPERSIVIDGHTDDEPISLSLERFYKTSWELSTGKADHVAGYFISKGLNPDLIIVRGHATNHPINSRIDIESDMYTDARIEIKLDIEEVDEH